MSDTWRVTGNLGFITFVTADNWKYDTNGLVFSLKGEEVAHFKEVQNYCLDEATTVTTFDTNIRTLDKSWQVVDLNGNVYHLDADCHLYTIDGLIFIRRNKRVAHFISFDHFRRIKG